MQSPGAHPDRRRVVLYTADSGLRRPGAMVREMFEDLASSRGLAWQLLIRDIRARYRQSFFGIAWAFLPAILMAIGCTVANRTRVVDFGETDIPYPAYVLIGMVFWQTFVDSVNGPITGASGALKMLSRIKFPREAVILSKVGEALFDFLVKLIPVVLVMVWYGIAAPPTILLVPASLLLLVAFGAAIGTLLAPIGLLYQDVSKGFGLITRAWLLLTPVIYAMPGPGTFGTIVRLNPVTPLLMTTRELLTTGSVSDPLAFAVVAGLTPAVLLGSWVAFRLAMPHAIERMTS
ncbi:ABC transporter permease [Tautonia sp. JC769]|uniref:ABC transporter permease n=1 Tax=Tautonia sp. JC769 TaxID=3232135 RepID=UPI003458AE8F